VADPINKLNNLTPNVSYKDLQTAITEINSVSLDQQEDIVFDFNGNSPLVNLRKGLQQIFKAKTIKKREKIGIAIGVLQKENYETQEIETLVFVDTPESNFVSIEHPDLFSNPFLDLSAFSGMVYYPVKESILDTEYPSFGDLVIVSQEGANEYDKKYLGIFTKSPKILPLIDDTKLKAFSKNIQLSKEQFRESLFSKQPTLVDNNDILDFPLKNEIIALDIPSLRIHPVHKYLQKTHYALDLKANYEKVYAPTDLEIVDQSFSKNGGNILTAKTKSGNFFLRFMHLSSFLKKVGDFVERGKEIAISGNTGVGTGPHLHFEVNLPGFSVSDPKQVNSLFLLRGQLKVSQGVINKFGLASDVLSLPLKQNDKIFASNTFQNINEKQQIPRSTKGAEANNSIAYSASPPRSRPRLLLTDFAVDFATGVRIDKYLGSNKILVREDTLADLSEIKDILNRYNIALTCNAEDINLINNKITFFSKIGLEINLNKYAGLSLINNLETDDYFVGPDYNYKIGNGYKLNVYGNVKRKINYSDIQYKPEKKIIDVYDGRSLNPNGPPKVKKILKNVINITQIFEDYGFKQVLPKQDFFLFSNIDNSNWFKFQNVKKIKKGDSYKDLLNTVYKNNGEAIWKEKDFIWDGEKFI